MGIIYKNGIAYGNQPNGTVPSGGTTGQVLKKVSNTDYDTEWANESGGGGGTSDIAEEYDPISGVYSVGDYCVYQTVLYKCITAISTPEAFDSTKWSEVTVGDELNGVKNTLNSLCIKGSQTAISANGTTSVSCTGLTANHKVCNWGLFSDSGYTTPISINDPPADITITEGSGSYSITIANFTSTFYMQPTFILPQN